MDGESAVVLLIGIYWARFRGRSKQLSKTKIFQARDQSSSLKGTIPADVVSALKLKDNDTIEWELVAESDKILAKVRKAEGGGSPTKGRRGS